MKTSCFLITITHEKDLPNLGELIAARAWSIDGVITSEVENYTSPDDDVAIKTHVDSLPKD